MLAFGTVVNIDEKLHRVKLCLPQYDNFETDWLFVPQLSTFKDKSSNLYPINTLCAAVCNDDMTDGCIVGAIYNDEDITVIGDENIKYIAFSDGALFQYDKENHVLDVIVPGRANIKAENLFVDGNIICSKDISDKNGTVQAIRDWSNKHLHTDGNNGGNTGVPTTRL